MPSELLRRQAIAQAVYMQFMLRRAEADPSPPAVTIVNVTLDDAALAQVIADIQTALQSGLPTAPIEVSAVMAPNPPSPRDQLAELLGMPPTLDTLVERSDTRTDSSIISLSREFYFHLSLSSRVYAKLTSQNADRCTEAFQAAVLRMNTIIEASYYRALGECTQTGTGLDIVRLNKKLDALRKTLLPEAHGTLMAEMARVGVSVPPEAWLKAKHEAEKTTATPNDVLCVDRQLGLATLIRGSEETAHNRKKGMTFAHRQLVTHLWQQEGTALRVSPNANPRVQIRTPSIAVKKGLGESAYAMDVATKLGVIAKDYPMASEGTPSPLPKAFVYNLYTAIHDFLGDRSGNLQTKSAEHIVLGVHQYNARQWLAIDTRFPRQASQSPPVLCLLQNISVNGFGQGLRYGSRYPLLQELTLMSELALLHTVYDRVPDVDKTAIQTVMERYHRFLNASKRPPYFSQSSEGKGAIADIARLKEKWATPTVTANSSDDVMSNACNGLRILMANNMHYGHQYAKLVQSLSVFVEPMSLGGCKSGNERAQSINGRVAILDAALSGKPEFNAIRTALKTLAVARNHIDAISAADGLKSALDKAYNEQGLQAAASVVSLIDQGASAKVEAKTGSHISRNYAEESSLSRLSQKNAGKMQAHKSLVDFMQGSWGYPKSSWSRIKANFFGKICIVIFPLLLIAFPVALIRGAFDNPKQKRKADRYHNAAKREESLPILGDPNHSTRMVLGLTERARTSATAPTTARTRETWQSDRTSANPLFARRGSSTGTVTSADQTASSDKSTTSGTEHNPATPFSPKLP